MVNALLSLSKAPTIRTPTDVRVIGEDPTKRKPVLRPEQATGRVDWRFIDANAYEDFQLLVEVKISSGFGKTQLQRYLSDGSLKRAERGGVIALTRDEPRLPLPSRVTRHRRWLGIVRWEDVLPKLRLDPDEHPSVDGLLWGALLDVAERTGDLGTQFPTWGELETARDEEGPSPWAGRASSPR